MIHVFDWLSCHVVDSDDSDDSVEFVNKGKGSSAKGKARRATSKSDKVARRMNKSKGYDSTFPSSPFTSSER